MNKEFLVSKVDEFIAFETENEKQIQNNGGSAIKESGLVFFSGEKTINLPNEFNFCFFRWHIFKNARKEDKESKEDNRCN